jgi:hypothetical protein
MRTFNRRRRPRGRRGNQHQWQIPGQAVEAAGLQQQRQAQAAPLARLARRRAPLLERQCKHIAALGCSQQQAPFGKLERQ